MADKFTKEDMERYLNNRNLKAYISYLIQSERLKAGRSGKNNQGYKLLFTEEEIKRYSINPSDSNSAFEGMVKKLADKEVLEEVMLRDWVRADAKLNKEYTSLPGGKNQRKPFEEANKFRSKALNDVKEGFSEFESKEKKDPPAEKKVKPGQLTPYKNPAFKATYKNDVNPEPKAPSEGVLSKSLKTFTALGKQLESDGTKAYNGAFKPFGSTKKEKEETERLRVEKEKPKAVDKELSAKEKAEQEKRQKEIDLLNKERVDEIHTRLGDAYPKLKKHIEATKKPGASMTLAGATYEVGKEGAKAVGKGVKKAAASISDYFNEDSLDADYAAGEISKEDWLKAKEEFKKRASERDGKKPAKSKTATGAKIANAGKTDAEIEDAAKRALGSIDKETAAGTPGKLSNFNNFSAALKGRNWSDADIKKFQSRLSSLLGETPQQPTTQTTAPATTTGGKKTTKTAIGGKVTTPATASSSTPAPNPSAPGPTAANPSNQVAAAGTVAKKTDDPSGRPDNADDVLGKGNAGSGSPETKKDRLWGTGQYLAATQAMIGLTGADKYSKLATSLIKNMPEDSIPLEAQIAYGDAQVAKNKMAQRAVQGLAAAQKAELEAKIENTAAADLAGAGGSNLSRRIAAKSKYDALLGLASVDEQVRSDNERKYLASLEGANQEARNIAAIKRQLYEDRRKRWEVEYSRAIMGETAGANLTMAGITNLAQSIQLKELERMKKPPVMFGVPEYKPGEYQKSSTELTVEQAGKQ